MPKSLLIPEDRQVQAFYEELNAIVSIRRLNIAEEVMEMAFECGEAVVNSPLYKKYSKGQGALLEDVAAHLKVSRAQLGYFIQAYERWGDAEACREELRKKLDKPNVFWSEVVKALPAPKDVSKPVETPKCKHCPLHCPND